MKPFPIGLRTIKTGLAVALSIFFALGRGSPTPIFAGIGAIVAMSRAWQDAIKACLTQVAGITCGMLIGWLFQWIGQGHFLLEIGAGIVLVILCCNLFHIEFAIPLSCIVFISICLLPPQMDYILYGINRLLDTSIGLVVALVINLTIKPYNNRGQILALIRKTQAGFASLVRQRVMEGHYPDLAPLQKTIRTLQSEVEIFAKQPNLPFLPHAGDNPKLETAYLQGCVQLLTKMAEELTSLCSMDVSPLPSPDLQARLLDMGICVDSPRTTDGSTEADRIVQAYHLGHLLDANAFLTELITQES